MIRELTLRTLEQAIQSALALDEQSVTRLAALDGKTLALVILPLGVRFFIEFTDHNLFVKPHTSHAPDCTIQSSPMGLVRLSLLPASKARSLFNDEIKMEGDAEFGEAVKALFDDLDIDWEGHLAYFTGDVVAQQIGNVVRKGLSFTEHIKNSLKNQFGDFFKEELRVAPGQEELRDFFDDVDSIRADIERLEAKVAQFKDTL